MPEPLRVVPVDLPAARFGVDLFCGRLALERWLKVPFQIHIGRHAGMPLSGRVKKREKQNGSQKGTKHLEGVTPRILRTTINTQGPSKTGGLLHSGACLGSLNCSRSPHGW